MSDNPSKQVRFLDVAEEEAGQRLDNYLLRVGGGELVARATSGQYFRISPVSRP